MNTILNIKTNKDLKTEAQALASELGIPLTTVVNSYLKQFIRDRKIVLGIDDVVNKTLMNEWDSVSKKAKSNKDISKVFHKKEDLFKYLKV